MASKAKVRLEAVNAADVRQALNGIDRQASQSSRRRMSATRRMATEEKNAAENLETLQERNSRKRERKDRDGHQKRMRYTREESREAQKSARQVAREQQQADRQRRRRIGAGIGAVVGGVTNGARAVLGRAQAYGGALGQLSREELVASSFRLRGSAARLAARRGGDTNEILSTVNTVAQETGVSQEELVGGLSQAQSRFASNFDFFEENLARLAEVSRASGQPLEVIVAALGKLADADPSLSGDSLLEAANLFTAIGSAGKVEFGELAQSFGQLLGVFQRGSGMHGEELVTNFSMLASMMAAGGQTDRQSATMVERMFQELNDPRAIGRMNQAMGRGRRAGSPVHVNGDIEQGIDMDAFMEMLTNPALQTQAARRGIFRSEESRRGLGVLQTAASDESLMSGLRGATAEQGAQQISDIIGALDAGNGHAAARVGINQTASFNAAGGTEQEFVGNMVTAASTIADYEAAHLGVIELLGGLKDVLVGIGGTALGLKMLGLGGGAAAAAGAGGAAAAGGGAAAAGGLGAAAILPLAAAGAAGLGAGNALDNLATDDEGHSFSRQLADSLYDAFHADQRGEVQSTERGLGSTRVYADGTTVTVRMDSDTTRAIGDATASALNSQTRRQEGGAARRGGS